MTVMTDFPSTQQAEPVIDATYKLQQKLIGEITGSFFIPGYQRGYRWAETDVENLLTDIFESNSENYSLQPIVVKLHRQAESPSEQEWELIDGQQRLTTLYLILRHLRELGHENGPRYCLHYQTREKSQAYLKTLKESEHTKNIDFFHLYNANEAIVDWFKKHPGRDDTAKKIYDYLCNSVSVIWYEAPAGADATALFRRLNVGRIPLTDADLIKAVLLTAVREKLPELATEIAAQWDGIERDLQRAEIWSFVAGINNEQSEKKYPTRISLLLDILANEGKKPDGHRSRHHTFDNLQKEVENDFQIFWQRVIALHAQIIGWHESPELYNKIGFLVAFGKNFGELASTAKSKRKSEFKDTLTSSIKSLLNVKDTELEDLKYDDKGASYTKLLQLLLLMNIETCSKSGLRFPFEKHVEENWSLEHIHAQNSAGMNNAKEWEVWLKEHKEAIVRIGATKANSQLEQDVTLALKNIAENKFSSEKFYLISTRVLQELGTDSAPDHSIQNLALLSGTDNSALNNSAFEVKRKMIIDLDRGGEYLPCCTRNVFLKYYSRTNEQLYFWSEDDKRNYLDTIRDILKPYLN